MPPKVEVDVPKMYRLWRDMTVTRREIAAMLGINNSTLEYLASKHKLPRRPSQRGNKEMIDPTPQEIEERARECRERHYASRRSEIGSDVSKRAYRERMKQARGSAAIVLILALIAGCIPGAAGKPAKYLVTLTRPDGVVHSTEVFESLKAPRVITLDGEGGCLRVRCYDGGIGCSFTRPYPAGWNVDIKQLPEDTQ
jgi:hypothetical protein